MSELQDIRFATLSPNNKKPAFIIDYETDDVFELYTVNLDGSELTKISIHEAYIVDASGQNNAKLSGTLHQAVAYSAPWQQELFEGVLSQRG